jgi:thiamine-phosphate pyrophosphorylase
MNTPNLHHSVSDIALAIADRFANLKVGESLSYSQCLGDSAVHPLFASLTMEMQGVWMGCRMLGFVDHDAQCIMRAWQMQSERMGTF